MRRIAFVLATVGIVAAGLAGTPAQARDGDDGWQRAQPQQQVEWRAPQWRGHVWREPQWREHRDWREDRDWRAATFERRAWPQIMYGLFPH